MIEAIDSFFIYHKTRLATINPARQMIMIEDAADWPPETVSFDAFYLLVLGDTPINKTGQSASVPGYSTVVQWTWLITGTDLTDGIMGRNRGDRYRKNYQMKKELLEASFPHYCEKLTYAVAPNNQDLVTTEFDPPEMIHWTPPHFLPKPVDKTSGIVYGCATVYISHWGDITTT